MGSRLSGKTVVTGDENLSAGDRLLGLHEESISVKV